MNKRLGNLEFRKATYLLNEPEHPSYHIDLWYPNKYYGRESEFEYDENGEFYYKKDFNWFRVHKSCFKNKESCYSIASFDYDKEGYYELKYIGERPIEGIKTPEEQNNFLELIKYGYSVLNQQCPEDGMKSVDAEVRVSYDTNVTVNVPNDFSDDDLKREVVKLIKDDTKRNIDVQILSHEDN